jgi:CMP-N,N'-diacetyllegionaminic acid synthase
MLALIPARGGSRGIPRKNVKEFLGRPLLAWAVDAAQASGVCERIVVSTEDEEIASIGRAAGAEVPFIRPAELASDEASTAVVARHALDALRVSDGWQPEHVLVLEPTSPARRPEHVREAAALLREADSVASISEVPHHYTPSKVLRLSADGAIEGADGTPVMNMIHRRQDLPPAYAFNGVVFGCHAGLLRNDPPTLWGKRVAGYVMDPGYAIDLDRPEDWLPAEVRVRELVRT